MSSSAVEKANSVVLEKEGRLIHSLNKQAHREAQRAEVCGCLNCKRTAVRIAQELHNETERQAWPPEVDHEEDYIMAVALRRLEEKLKEDDDN